jgi:hypothetical protein
MPDRLTDARLNGAQNRRSALRAARTERRAKTTLGVPVNAHERHICARVASARNAGYGASNAVPEAAVMCAVQVGIATTSVAAVCRVRERGSVLLIDTLLDAARACGVRGV